MSPVSHWDYRGNTFIASIAAVGVPMTVFPNMGTRTRCGLCYVEKDTGSFYLICSEVVVGDAVNILNGVVGIYPGFFFKTFKNYLI